MSNICLKTKDNVTNFDDNKILTFSFFFFFFFDTLADNLVANLRTTSLRFGLTSVGQYYEKILKLPNSKFKFNFVSKGTVLKLLKDLDENKAAGLDNLPGKFLKDGATVLAKPISQICNLTTKYSIFLSDCKVEKLKPLFKKDSKTAPKNYCTITLLPLVSKIIEKVIHDQAQSILDKNNTIYRYQSGFRKFFFH